MKPPQIDETAGALGGLIEWRWVSLPRREGREGKTSLAHNTRCGAIELVADRRH
jgi:hypothetical protein